MQGERRLETKERQVSLLKANTPYPRPGYHSIGEILANDKWPNKFRLTARIKDFYPLQLEDFVVLRCMQCEEECATHIFQQFSQLTLRPSSLRVNHRECVKCCDMVNSTVKCLYRFFFRFEDEEGNELTVSVAHQDVRLRLFRHARCY